MEAARFAQLAEASKFDDRRAGYRLGEGAAWYEAGEFRRARSAFSEALLSDDPAVTGAAHLGMGNVLFQNGWKLLNGKRYPDLKEAPADFASFDQTVRDFLSRMGEAQNEEDAPGAPRLKSLIVQWTDAVRHYESAMALNPSAADARTNRDLTMAYLKRLAKLLEEEKENTESQMPEESPSPSPQGQGGEKPKEGDEKKEGGNEGDQPNESGSSGDEKKDSENRKGEGRQPEKPEQGESKDDSENKDQKGKPQPDESPEDRARRILRENADLERGALTPGRREFMIPEKDW